MKRKKLFPALIIMMMAAIAVGSKLAANKRTLDAAREAGTSFNMVIPVMVEEAGRQHMATGFTVNGSFYPLHEVTVVSEVEGQVMDIMADVGNRIEISAHLAIVDSEATEARLKQAENDFEKAKKDLERFHLLIKSDAASAKQYESVNTEYVNAHTALVIARKQMEESVIRAPFSGIIARRHIEKGSFLVPGAPAFKIIDVSKIKFICHLTADRIGKVKKGETVAITVDSLPDASFEGKVATIVIDADASKRYRVEIEADNTENLILPGMFGTVSFAPRASSEILTIPRKALTGSIKTPEVFIARGNTAKLQRIIAEPVGDDYLAVIEGVASGDKIVVSGQINLEDGSLIKVVNQGGRQ